MKKLASLFTATVAIVLMILAPVASADKAKAAGTRIVIQVNDDDSKKWHGILANVHNIQVELGKDKVAIAVVAIGPGLDMLMADSLAANGVQDAMADGVEFIACGNTMSARKIDRKDLIDGIGYSRAGYVEIVRRQQQGWIYLRP
ncbi:MAG TPA: DsrE family protein [Rhodocyclaceae bacterium]|nr:DsrE family protein [Rhodocyclaceae bacterium]